MRGIPVGFLPWPIGVQQFARKSSWAIDGSRHHRHGSDELWLALLPCISKRSSGPLRSTEMHPISVILAGPMLWPGMSR
jgi:hypothetical protein